MTALILVLFFVLSIFMIVQFVLRDTITGQGQQLEELSVQVANLADALGLERSRADREAALVATLTGEKAAAEAADRRRCLDEQAAAEARIADFEAQVASLIARNTDLGGQLTAAQSESAERLSANEALEASLAQARGELDAGAEAARLAAARREALEALVASLRTDVAGLEGRTAEQAAALAAAQEAAAAQGEQLDEAEAARLVEAAAAEALRERLAGRRRRADGDDAEPRGRAEEGRGHADAARRRRGGEASSSRASRRRR